MQVESPDSMIYVSRLTSSSAAGRQGGREGGRNRRWASEPMPKFVVGLYRRPDLSPEAFFANLPGRGVRRCAWRAHALLAEELAELSEDDRRERSGRRRPRQLKSAVWSQAPGDQAMRYYWPVEAPR